MALPTEEQKKVILDALNRHFRENFGTGAVPAAIGEEGKELNGAEEIYEELTKEIVPEEEQEVIHPDPAKIRRGRVLIPDPEIPGAYYRFELDRDNQLVRQWVTPENFAQVVPEGHENVNAPEKPEYMTRPDEPEQLTQSEAVMIPEDLRAYTEKTWRSGLQSGTLKPLNNYGEPLATVEDVLETLSKGDAVYMPEGEAGYRRLMYGDGQLYQSAEAVPSGEYVPYDQMRPVAISLGPREAYLEKNGFVTAQDAQGNVYTTREEILAQLDQEGKALLLFNKDRSLTAAAMRKDGEFKATNPRNTADTDPVFYDRYPGMLPEDGSKILTFEKDEIDHAVDETGKEYETADAVLIALYGTDKHLSIYKKGEDAPYDVFKKNNRFYVGKKVDQIDESRYQTIDVLEESPEKQFLQRHWTFDDEMTPKERKGLEEIGKAFGPSWIDDKAHFAFALDKDGRMYRDPDSAAAYLSAEDGNRLFIFDKDGELPYAVEKKDGRMCMSNGPVSSQNRLRESDPFEPKKSLAVDDIIKRADYTKVTQSKDDVSDWKKMQKFYQKNIEQIEFVKNEGKPVEPKKPKKPSLGFWSTLAYWGKLIVTFGRGDTQAHRDYVEALESYPHVLASYPARLEEFKKKDQRWKEYEANGEARLTEYREGLERAKTKLGEANAKYNDVRDTYNAQLKGNDVGDVRIYRDNLEVKMEGVADLQKEGKITRNNIFAHTWLKEAECDGKKASDPKAKEALCAYIASRAVEEQILSDRVSGKLVNEGVENRRVDDLNSGKAYSELAKDPDLNNMLDEMGDGTINAYTFYNDFTKKLAKRQYEAKGYQAVYTEVGKAMNFTFGKKEIDESCVDDLIRLHRLNKLYERDKAYALPYDEKTANEMHQNARNNVRNINRDPITEKERAPFLEAVNALKAENKGPMGLDDMLKAVKDKNKELIAQAEAQGPQGPQAQ